MNDFLTLLATYGTFLLPFFVSFFGSIIIHRKGIGSIREAVKDITNHEDIKKLAEENRQLREEVRQANRSVRLLTDKIVKIQGYSNLTLDGKKED